MKAAQRRECENFSDVTYEYSGAMGHYAMIRLTSTPLDPDEAVRAVLTDTDGAYVLFVGVVRNHSRGKTVTGLEYQAYAPLAVSQMEKIADEVREKWGLACAILHRTGYVAIGEAAVVVCVAASHRGDAFEACKWAIDTIKTDVPIWKREFADDGTYWIEGSDALPAAGDALPAASDGKAAA